MLQIRRLILLATLGVAACATGARPTTDAVASWLALGSATAPAVLPNDNRTPAGTLRAGILTLDLDAVRAAWRPDENVDTTVTVFAFAERGGPPRIPGPLIRVPQGTDVQLRVRNLIAGETLLFFGRDIAAPAGDTLRIVHGGEGELRFSAADPGTFLYRATTESGLSDAYAGRDMLLAGAVVVDPPGTAHEDDRIFVVSLIDVLPDSATGATEDIWEIAINGRSWPHTERLHHSVGDTVRWRWINATDRIHPMHLHGFHFRVLAKGDGRVDTIYAPEARRLAVTESMMPGTTFRMEWVPTRAGNWLMHCHMLGHITPFPARDEEARAHDAHDLLRHAEEAMAGLVLAISTTGERENDPALARGGVHHRLFVQESPGDSTRGVRRGYVLQRGSERPRPDSVEVPGSPLVVTRDQTTTVTIINRLRQATSVHWHGMELESVFDGVPGFSGVGDLRSPLIAPGDSFTVSFTPPRAGTYMYHTHMDEEEQLTAGMYAPLIVLEPGEQLDGATDLTLLIGDILDAGGKQVRALNGAADPAPIVVTAGVPHRLRLINLMPNAPVRIAFRSGDSVLEWRWISKDGADVPETLRGMRAAGMERLGVGEAYDFEWTPGAGEEPVLSFEFVEAGAVVAAVRQRFEVRR